MLTDLEIFLGTLFRPGELIGLQLDVYNTKVGTAEEHLASEFWNWKYVCINPLDSSGLRRASNVTEFRNSRDREEGSKINTIIKS